MIPFVTKWVEFPPPSLIGVLRSSILGTSPLPGLVTEWVQVVGHRVSEPSTGPVVVIFENSGH